MEIYQNLAESIATLLAPLVEVSLLNQQGDFIAVYNRITHESIPSLLPNQSMTFSTNKNQILKAMLIPLEHDYSLRMIADTTLFDHLHTFLGKFLSKKATNEMSVSWERNIDEFIEKYLEQQQLTLQALNPQEKRTLLFQMNRQRLLKYQDATNYLASKLNVSRATIYNYLNQANQFNSLQLHQVDTFTDEPFSGNPAGVVLDANELTESTMKKIAREMNCSETSFVMNSNKADIKLRYFTPTGCEVKFCGHSTVGALYMLARNKMHSLKKPKNYVLTIETSVGIIPANIAITANDNITIAFQTPPILPKNSEITHKVLADVLGISIDMINTKVPVMFEQINQDIFIHINSLENLGKIQIDQKSAKRFAEKHNIVAFSLVTNQTFSKNSHFHMRCFAPAVGITEDPFTGSVLGGLVYYLKQNNLIDNNLKILRVEQGHFIERPGYVDININQNPPRIIAKARHFFSTEIIL